MTERACPACGSESLKPFFAVENVPVHCNVFRNTAGEARSVARGAIHLSVCTHCGLVHNTAFDPGRLEYGGHYEASLHFSPHFRQWADALADRLVDSFGLADGELAVEFGSGKGEFLSMLVARGARGLGFDESYAGEVDDTAPPGLEIRRSFFDATNDAPHGFLDASVVLARHVLEHVPDPRGFVASLRPALRESGGGLYIEVPDATFTLRDRGIWDLIYEHCSYFTPVCLERLLTDAGVSLNAVRAGEYGGQFLCVEGRWDPDGPDGVSHADFDARVAEVVAQTEGFAPFFESFTSEWNDRLDSWISAGRTIAVQGMGSKGVTFLNLMRRGVDIRHCIDKNPRKSGLFVPGTAQRIVTVEEVAELPESEHPDIVLVMNPLYLDEIGDGLRDAGLGAAEVHGVS